jgi:hypothetical protein
MRRLSYEGTLAIWTDSDSPFGCHEPFLGDIGAWLYVAVRGLAGALLASLLDACCAAGVFGQP